jgi:CrcB protein
VNPVLLVGVGGTLGALARHLLGERIDARTRDTLAVNVLGSLLLGALVALPVGESALLLAGTGFCGAFTTFSTFAFETMRRYETRGGPAAARNAALNLAGSLAAVAAGGALAGVYL